MPEAVRRSSRRPRRRRPRRSACTRKKNSELQGAAERVLPQAGRSGPRPPAAGLGSPAGGAAAARVRGELRAPSGAGTCPSSRRRGRRARVARVQKLRQQQRVGAEVVEEVGLDGDLARGRAGRPATRPARASIVVRGRDDLRRLAARSAGSAEAAAACGRPCRYASVGRAGSSSRNAGTMYGGQAARGARGRALRARRPRRRAW